MGVAAGTIADLCARSAGQHPEHRLPQQPVGVGGLTDIVPHGGSALEQAVLLDGARPVQLEWVGAGDAGLLHRGEEQLGDDAIADGAGMGTVEAHEATALPLPLLGRVEHEQAGDGLQAQEGMVTLGTVPTKTCDRVPTMAGALTPAWRPE